MPFGGLVGELPDFPGCAPEGDTMDDLLENVPEAVMLWLAEKGSPSLPVPSPCDGEEDGCPPLLVDLSHLPALQEKTEHPASSSGLSPA